MRFERDAAVATCAICLARVDVDRVVVRGGRWIGGDCEAEGEEHYMAIIAKEPESTFTPCPEGLHHAVCVDVIDLGVLQTNWGDKHKVRIVWQVEEENTDTGRRFDVRKHYNLSLHTKATLRKDLESWRGRTFSETELGGFDLEQLIGANGQVQVVQDITDESKVYANVQALVPPPKGTTKLVPLDYTRVKDRQPESGNGQGAAGGGGDELDSVPF